MTVDEGSSYSSPTSTIDLQAKVMSLWGTKGWLQQLQWHLFSLVCFCMHACVSQPHVYLLCTTTSHKVSSFSLSQSFSVTFPPFIFLSSLMLHRVHAQNTDQYTSFCIYHTCTCSPLAQHQTERAIWFAFLSREADQLWPLCQHMKWNQMPGTPVSENWNHSTVCENKPGLYSPISPIEKRIHSQ